MYWCVCQRSIKYKYSTLLELPEVVVRTECSVPYYISNDAVMRCTTYVKIPPKTKRVGTVTLSHSPPVSLHPLADMVFEQPPQSCDSHGIYFKNAPL